ncbi:MAG: GNAT family N-acetyltransferase [Clostridiales bacterium]|nr:GNAT family N-acetyltransferase [Clostridiales bacterium]
MDAFFDERDKRLLEKDKYTFCVMKRVMDGDCALRLSDHEKLIVCYTGRPYPVWVWTKDGAENETMETAWRLLNEHGLMRPGQRFNLKYPLAEFFIGRAEKEGRRLSVSTNMFAYDCPEPKAPRVKAEGCLHKCAREDARELSDFIRMMAEELDSDKKTASEYLEDAEKFISQGNTYFWQDAEGSNVASCKFNPGGELASVALVFTRPEYRRRHYAENLVYQVTLKALEAGCLPMLYTDADYAASNACYTKIGYRLRGKLCTVECGERTAPD